MDRIKCGMSLPQGLIKKYKSGCDSIDDVPKLGRPCTATSKTMA